MSMLDGVAIDRVELQTTFEISDATIKNVENKLKRYIPIFNNKEYALEFIADVKKSHESKIEKLRTTTS